MSLTCLTRQVQLVEQGLLVIPDHSIASLVFNWVRVAQYLVFCGVLWTIVCCFYVDHCIVCPSISEYTIVIFLNLFLLKLISTSNV